MCNQVQAQKNTNFTDTYKSLEEKIKSKLNVQKTEQRFTKKEQLKKGVLYLVFFFGLGIATCQAGSFVLVYMLLQHSFLDKALWLDHLRCGQTT